MGGVDTATPYFTGWGIGPEWSRTPEGKRYIGEVVRWMRAMVVKKWMDQQIAAEYRPEPAHDAPVGSPNPEPVDIDAGGPRQPTSGVNWLLRW